MKQLPLSVIILTNRSDQQFLESLACTQFAAEVLIVDNNSGNDWKQISKKYAFKVVSYDKPITNFAAVRNWALKQATHDWVLFLDSDEVLDQQASEQIKTILLEDLYDGLYLQRSDVFLGQQLSYGEAGNQPMLRLFKKDLTHFNLAVHEVAKVAGRVGQTDIHIYHYAHPSLSEFIDSITLYSQQIAQTYSRGKSTILFELVCFPPAKFMLNYFLRLGFLDGWPGLAYAAVMSIHSLAVRANAYEKQHEKSHS